MVNITLKKVIILIFSSPNYKVIIGV